MIQDVAKDELDRMTSEMKRLVIAGALNNQFITPNQRSPFDHVTNQTVKTKMEATFPRATYRAWTHFDSSGLISGSPQQVNIDLVEQDGKSFLIGIEAHLSSVDLKAFLKIGRLFKQENPTTAIGCVLFVFGADVDACLLASQSNVKIVSV